MSQTITGKIDVNKIDKSKLFKGKAGTYLDVVIFLNDAPDQYGNNGMIVQSVSQDERKAGKKGAILGNVKATGHQQSQTPKSQVSYQPANNIDDNDDGLPF